MVKHKLSGILIWEAFLTKKRSVLNRYGFAFILSIFALMFVIFLQKVEGGAPFTSLAMLTVLLTTIYGGVGPAFLDTIISSIGINYFFSEPYFQVFDSPSSIMRIIVHLLVGFVIANLVDSLKDNFLKLREEKLKVELEKRSRENVLGIVSHDLRAPLASILMSADMLLKNINLKENQSSDYKILTLMRNSGLRMNRMIEDLLDAVKVEAGSFKIDKKECEVSVLVKLAVRESTPSGGIKNVKLTSDLEREPITIKCDETRIIQVLNNLIGNAIKFSKNNSDVLISQFSTNEETIIRITDHGDGISQEDKRNLFNRYWQAKESAHKGTGLGLFISKSIIKLHGGRIEVDSVIGSGSTFTVYLPRV